MFDSRAHHRDVHAESAHARQLRRGFPRLKFEPPLEEEFRQVHRAETLAQTRRNLWIAILFVVGFSALTRFVLAPEVNDLLDAIRLAVFGPAVLLGLGVVYSRLYHRMYSWVSLVGAGVVGSGVAVVAAIAAAHGVNLISTVVLTSIYIYFMLGMTFYAAAGAVLCVSAAYFLAAAVLELPVAVQLLDAGVLISTNVIGAMVAYSLEHATRTNYLEECLLIEVASRDGLTGIRNRRFFDEQLERLWPQALRERCTLALMLVDIDHFKAYNDHYGHQAGDECLRRVAASLSSCVRRPLDVTARYGGEEFAIVLYDARREHLEEAGRRIQASIERLAIEHLASPAPAKRLTVSIGAASVVPATGRSAYGLIQLADEALYAAKARGRNCLMIMDKEYEQLHTGSFRHTVRRDASHG